MSVTFSRTREQLAQSVLRKIGVLGNTTSVVSADADIVYEALDLRIKEMHRLGQFWRGVNPRTIDSTIPANIRSVSAASLADVLFPVAIHVVDGSRDEPVEIISYTEYAAIYDKNQTGLPEKAVWTGSRSAEFIVWPVPTANTTMKLTYERILDDTTAGSAADIEISMVRWMKDILCYDVGDSFGVDEQKMMRFEREAKEAEKNIRKLNAPRVTYGPVAVDDWEKQTGRETDYGM